MILRLSDTQKRIYDFLYSEMVKGHYTITLPRDFPKNSINIIVKLVLGDHPELINFDNCCVYFGRYANATSLSLQPVFSDQEFPAAQKRFDSEVQRILRQVIKPNATPIQRVLAIHDYLVNHVVYDHDDASGRKPSILSHTAYGAIVNKKAVCEGISYAFSLLAHQAGIEATVVNGMAGGEHAWNMVRINSEHYHMDVTWDIRKRANPKVKAYDYFCLSDHDLRHRNWEKALYPVCNSARYNYFQVTKSFAHNKKQLREIIFRQYKQYKALYLKHDFLHMESARVIDYIWNELLSVATEKGLSVDKVTCVLNDDQNIFILYSQ